MLVLRWREPFEVFVGDLVAGGAEVGDGVVQVGVLVTNVSPGASEGALTPVPAAVGACLDRSAFRIACWRRNFVPSGSREHGDRRSARPVCSVSRSSSTGKDAARPPAHGSPRSSSAACAATARSPHTNHRPNLPTASCCPSAKPQTNSASPPPPSSAGSKPASSAANKTPQARPGGSASTTSSARCSSNTHHPATSRSSTRCGSSACPAKRCCSVSSTASCKASTSATDAEKACEY